MNIYFIRFRAGEFDLVCDRSNLVSTAQTLYFFGMIFGVFTFGVLGICQACWFIKPEDNDIDRYW
jgi:hypothetical protein